MSRLSGYSKSFAQRIKAYETAETLVVIRCFHVAQFQLIEMAHQFDLLTYHDPWIDVVALGWYIFECLCTLHRVSFAVFWSRSSSIAVFYFSADFRALEAGGKVLLCMRRCEPWWAMQRYWWSLIFVIFMWWVWEIVPFCRQIDNFFQSASKECRETNSDLWKIFQGPEFSWFRDNDQRIDEVLHS